MTVLHLALPAAAHVLATGGVAKSGEAAKSGPIGFAVILVLCVACYFLFKSMSRHLRKVREEFPKDEPAAPGSRSTPAAPPAVTGPAPQVPQASQVQRQADASSATEPKPEA